MVWETGLPPPKLHFIHKIKVMEIKVSFLSTGRKQLNILFHSYSHFFQGKSFCSPKLYNCKEVSAFSNTQARIHASASIAPSCLVLSSIAPNHGRTFSRKIFIVSMVAILLITPTQRAAMCLTAVLGCWRHIDRWGKCCINWREEEGVGGMVNMNYKQIMELVWSKQSFNVTVTSWMVLEMAPSQDHISILSKLIFWLETKNWALKKYYSPIQLKFRQ